MAADWGKGRSETKGDGKMDLLNQISNSERSSVDVRGQDGQTSSQPQKDTSISINHSGLQWFL